jgi:hypothetical protein
MIPRIPRIIAVTERVAAAGAVASGAAGEGVD